MGGLGAPTRVLEHLDNPVTSGLERDPSLVILVGVSGAGKDSLINEVVAQRAVRKPISATTRAPREGEVSGRDYHFLSREEFEAKIAAGEVFEWAEFNGNYYGTLLSELEGEGLKLGIRENQGAKEMKERLGAIVIGVFPPSLEVMAERLRARGDDPKDIASRLEIDRDRAEEIRGFADYIVVNDDLDEASEALTGLLDELYQTEALVTR